MYRIITHCYPVQQNCILTVFDGSTEVEQLNCHSMNELINTIDMLNSIEPYKDNCEFIIFGAVSYCKGIINRIKIEAETHFTNKTINISYGER